MLDQMTHWLVETILGLGYPGIFLLMAVESSFIPFPSEVVLIPAGYLVHKGEMDLMPVMVSATLGSLLGAFINYYLARWLGRPFLVHYGHYVFISEQTLDKLDRFFKAHGHVSTFTGRLIPGIRQLISVPAGLTRMHLPTFAIYTALGAAIWSLILVLLGYFIGENEALIRTYLKQITIIVVALVAVLLAGYFWYIRRSQQND